MKASVGLFRASLFLVICKGQAGEIRIYADAWCPSGEYLRIKKQDLAE